jgi:hypothetical protein
MVISSASLDFDHLFDDTLLTDAGVFHTRVLTTILQIETVFSVSKVSEMHLFGNPCLTERRTRQGCHRSWEAGKTRTVRQARRDGG